MAAYAVADGPTVTVSTWTTADGRLSRPSDGPVILYARVMDGSFPVAGASVLAEVRGPQGGLVSVDLVDDGSGYPDVTSGDGIYRYLKLYFRLKREKKVNYSNSGYRSNCKLILCNFISAVT